MQSMGGAGEWEEREKLRGNGGYIKLQLKGQKLMRGLLEQLRRGTGRRRGGGRERKGGMWYMGWGY